MTVESGSNSTRTILQSTYSPIKIQYPPNHPVKRALEKWSFFISLKPSAEELASLRNHFQTIKSEQLKKDILESVSIIESALQPSDLSSNINSIQPFGDLSPDVCIRIMERLVKLREENIKSIIKDHESILRKFYEKDAKSLQQLSSPKSSHFAQPKTAKSSKKMEKENSIAETRDSNKTTMNDSMKSSIRKHGITPMQPSEAVTLTALLEFASENGMGDHMLLTKTIEIAKHLPMPMEMMTVKDFNDLSLEYVSHSRNLASAFSTRMKIDPIGFLHLERISFTPVGIERGELAYSLPLSPMEEVNITHKEWSNTTTEFEKLATDFMEGFSEQGVTEKLDLAESTTSQAQHSSGLNTGVTASGGYGTPGGGAYVNITGSFAYNVADSASQSAQISRNHSSELTHKASTRVRKEHKTSFKVASAAGTEDQQVRKVKNPFKDKATRADFYELIRKWRVDLHRYGVRLTFDIAIPEPGSEILSKIREINGIYQQLDQPFKFPIYKEDPSSVDDINETNYNAFAGRYFATVDPPPTSHTTVETFKHQWEKTDQGVRDSVRGDVFSFDINIEEKFEIESADFIAEGFDLSWHRTVVPRGTKPVPPDHHAPPEILVMNSSPRIDFSTDTPVYSRLDNLIGLSGKVTISFLVRNWSNIAITLKLNLKPKEEELRNWKNKTWNTIKEAAEAQDAANRAALKEKLSRLMEELGAQDALSLRKREREEVMKGVLRWLFGFDHPKFRFNPAGMPSDLYDINTQMIINDATWVSVLYFGEIIKFLHHAIEWENMLYILYPYFWSHLNRWEFKKYLDHPDPLHKAFLRAGSARVVVTIRPGFEKSFIAFLETGQFDPSTLKPDHPYLTIAQEMENYAKTNYPGIPAANPVLDARPLVYPEQRKAWEDMKIIIELLDLYYNDPANNKTYPTTAQGLAVLAPYLRRLPRPVARVPRRDPWNRDYVYESPGTHGDYDLICYGSDGDEGGTENDADITSWAEASLIGTWYEYTPTSALDVDFDKSGMPTR